ncbi:hypothetical protein FHX48_001702 [Microbacterium halimionae]|uniref:Protein-glutamine gamma-glutamyltransferase-like C-terminal domain-containing protein n=1 Tax=Microbacterium halimionae TaxID=1526413 RepID=A0A7W3PM78_9MICO|nr:DUF4129 domain-containing protein [Microbacterium halimionae]MBA8816629.1 hypothetical protein [Microbacterium halimionae]NII95184.1 hypothetical protein [Microbacterium halimionae]
MTGSLAVVPVIPDGDEARRLAEEELSRNTYEVATPTAFDRAVGAVVRAIEEIFTSDVSGGWGRSLAVIALVIVIALVVVGFLVWGRPRSRVRTQPQTADLFGLRETRSAGELRTVAEQLALEQKWDEAIIVRFRALALALTERGVVETPPGTTAQGFARQAAAAIPSHEEDLFHAATVFDEIRYLRRSGQEPQYTQIVKIDESLGTATSTLASTAVQVTA